MAAIPDHSDKQAHFLNALSATRGKVRDSLDFWSDPEDPELLALLDQGAIRRVEGTLYRRVPAPQPNANARWKNYSSDWGSEDD